MSPHTFLRDSVRWHFSNSGQARPHTFDSLNNCDKSSGLGTNTVTSGGPSDAHTVLHDSVSILGTLLIGQLFPPNPLDLSQSLSFCYCASHLSVDPTLLHPPPQFAVGMYLVTYVGARITGLTLVTLAWAGIFSLPR